MTRWAFALLLALLALPGQTQAQRREGDSTAAPLVAKLEHPTRFAGVTIPAGEYRLFPGEAVITFADPSSMVTVASVPAQSSTSDKAVATPKAEVQTKGQEVRVVVHHSDTVLTAVGQKVMGKTDSPAEAVQYEKKPEAALEGDPSAAADELALMDGAWKRYLTSIKQCADGAHRGRWTTDDPRFVRCVCPILEKWRMPKAKAELRLHRAIAKGRAGVSFTVGVDGRTRDCRVWVGARSPEESPASGGAAGANATPVADVPGATAVPAAASATPKAAPATPPSAPATPPAAPATPPAAPATPPAAPATPAGKTPPDGR